MAFSNSWVVIGGNLSSKWGASSPQHLQPSVGQRKNVVHCQKPKSDSNNPLLSTTMSNGLKTKFMQVYDQLKSELIHDPSFEFDDASPQWVDRMIDYNVLGGISDQYSHLHLHITKKWIAQNPTLAILSVAPQLDVMYAGKMIRGLSVADNYQLLKGEHLTDDEVFLASALGWCIEWHQSYIAGLDDIIDDSHTRRGHPCWFRLPEVGMSAVNDAVILRSHISRILKRHFSGKDYYVNLLEVFNEAEFHTFYGQMIDAITPLVGEKDLSKYTMPLHRRICLYKSSHLTFTLPVACAYLMFGENLDDHVQVKDILLEMGIYFQVQDDYLDTFGDPSGENIGTDIEEFKCTWLVVKALELSSKEQKKILKENYGVKDPDKVEKVKKLYHTLNLERVYEDYESKSHAELIKSIEVLPSKAAQAVLKSLLGKVYKRQK